MASLLIAAGTILVAVAAAIAIYPVLQRDMAQAVERVAPPPSSGEVRR